MTQEEQTYWQIHDFLKGRLSGEELESFQKQVEQNVSLQEELARHKLANQLIIQNRLQLAHQISLETKSQYKKTLLNRKIGIGSGIGLIAGILLFLGLQTTKNTSVLKEKRPQEIVILEETEIEPVKRVESEILKKEKSDVVKVREAVHPARQSVTESVSQPLKVPQQMEKEITVETVKSSEVTTISPKTVEEKPILPELPKKEEVLSKEKTCSDVKIKANISVTNACQGNNNGTITASHFQGGKAPYHYEVHSPHLSQILSHSELPLGTYVVLITDAMHCTTKIDNVVIKGVICEEEEKAFNPFLDEVLELPAYSSGGTFIVHEKNGSVFYRKEIIQGEKIEWNGMSMQGQLESGHFSYEIQYHDGARKQGAITITR